MPPAACRPHGRGAQGRAWEDEPERVCPSVMGFEGIVYVSFLRRGLLPLTGRSACERSEHWTQRFDRYREAGPQLLLQAYLQKVVNGGGRVEREYALGRGRVDLLILWPQGGRVRRFVVECKVRRDGLERTVREGVEQTRGYMDRCGAESGHLIVFDRSEAKDMGGEDLSPQRAGRRRRGAGHRLGHVAALHFGAPGASPLALGHGFATDPSAPCRTARYCLTYFRIRCGPTSAA